MGALAETQRAGHGNRPVGTCVEIAAKAVGYDRSSGELLAKAARAAR